MATTSPRREESRMLEYTDEDVSNIVSLEHVNLQVPDQAMATVFYIVGLGLTRDPYLNVGLGNMWANVGEQQFHLPTRSAQKISGYIDLVLPDLDALEERLSSIKPALEGTQFSWSSNQDHVAVTCPWGNRFRCHKSGPAYGDMAQGLAAVDFNVTEGTAAAIAGFYQNVLAALWRMLILGVINHFVFGNRRNPSLLTMVTISPSMWQTFHGHIIFLRAVS
jgi:hypothetical protein